MQRIRSSLLLFLLLLVVIAVVTSFGPPEQSLGRSVRVVYLHGAWVWTALLAFAAAAISGAVGWLTRSKSWLAESAALGRTGTVFWVTYLPLSLWAMQANWNGLFLQEPRWRVALDFAVLAVAVQLAAILFERPRWTAAMNVAYMVILSWSLATTQQVMHPSSPIFQSGSNVIRLYFVGLLALCLMAGWFLSRWLRPEIS
ncbi:MAG: hypothetical protein WBR18_04875 [Anaerolineales bacterium]